MKTRDIMIRLPGSDHSFRCDCGCNVFRNVEEPNFMPDGTGPVKINKNKFRCDSCGAVYIGE